MIKKRKIYKIIYFLVSKIMKKPISATIEDDLIKWIAKKVSKEKTRYRNKSHLIEIALEKMREEEGE